MTQHQTLQGSYLFQRQAVNSLDISSVQPSPAESCAAFSSTLLSHLPLPSPIAAEVQGVKEGRWRTEKSHPQRLFIVNIKPFLTLGEHKKFSPNSDNFISKNVKQGSWLNYFT